MIWKLEDLIKYTKETKAEINGKWVPVRPLYMQPIRFRVKQAWAVLIGKADSFTWPEGQ